MISLSKGDFLFEPLEILVEFIFRLLGKSYFRSAPETSISEWGLTEWAWVLFTVALVIVILWQIIRFFSNSDYKKRLRSHFIKRASVTNKITMWAMFFIATLFLLIGIWMGLVASSVSDSLVGWICALLSAAAMSSFVYMLKVKSSALNSNCLPSKHL